MTISASLGALLYAVLAATVWRRDNMRLLGETYAALAVALGTLAIFFAFDAYPTFALWTIEGAAVVWVGFRQRRVLARLFGLALQIAGAFYFLAHYREYDLSNPWFNDFFLGCLFVTAAGLWSAWLTHRHQDVVQASISILPHGMLAWGALWWFVAGLHPLHLALPRAEFHAAASVFASLSFVLAELAGTRLAWRGLRAVTVLHLAVLFVAALWPLADGIRHPLAGSGAFVWPLSFAVYFWVLHRHLRDGIPAMREARYFFGWIVMGLLATWEALWLLSHAHYELCLGWATVGLAAAYLRFHLRERDRNDAPRISVAVMLWGLAFWFASGLGFIHEHLGAAARIGAGLGWAAGSVALFELAGSWLSWPAMRRTHVLVLLAMITAALLQFEADFRPSLAYGWIAWPLAFAVFHLVLRRQEEKALAFAAPLQHVAALWLLVWLATSEAHAQLARFGLGEAWLHGALGAVPALAMVAVARLGRAGLWPVGPNLVLYRDPALLPIAIYAMLWLFLANVARPGSPDPFPYLPFLYGIDIGSVLVLVGLHAWGSMRERGPSVMPMVAAALGFLWINGVVLRSIHFWADVPYRIDALLESVLVQATFSLLWSATALALMVAARRRMQRLLWIVGAALLAVVVAKLFLVDLAHSGTIARIVSFLGVGVLLLVIGYMAPVPPGGLERARD